MSYTYILKCSDNTFYTGWTKNLDRRLEEHSKGTGSKYTRARLPVELVYYERFLTDSEARKREIEIKKLTRKKKLSLVESFSEGME
mgnify:CR=1 FL=1